MRRRGRCRTPDLPMRSQKSKHGPFWRKRMNSFNIAAAFLSALLLTGANANSAETKVLKLATLAPDGSSWMVTLSSLNKDLQEKTAGTLRFKFYAGGVSGDEKDVVK